MPRQTGPSKEVRAIVAERDGWSCLRCGRSQDPWPDYQLHHRRPRGMGGSRAEDTNSPQNLVLLCGIDHAEIESDREQAYKDGWLVHQGKEPANVPVLRHDGVWVFLNHDGTTTVRGGVRTAQFRIPPTADSPTLLDEVEARQGRTEGGAA